MAADEQSGEQAAAVRMAAATPAVGQLPPGGQPAGIGHTFRALRHRNFRLFISGQIISLVGTWMQNVAESWLVYRLTHSELLLGNGLVLFADRSLRARTAGRVGGRPVLAAQTGDRHPDPGDVAGLRAGCADAHRTRPGLAPAGDGRPAGRDQCLRHAGPAGAGHPDDRQGRSAQCDLAELRHIQRRARVGTGGRRPGGCGGRRGTLFPAERPEFPGGDRLPSGHAASTLRAARSAVSLAPPGRRLPLRRAPSVGKADPRA